MSHGDEEKYEEGESGASSGARMGAELAQQLADRPAQREQERGEAGAITLGKYQTITEPLVGNEENPQPAESFKFADGTRITGVPQRIIRIGGGESFVDMVVLDTRAIGSGGEGSEDSSAKDMGVHRHGERLDGDGDRVLLIPSADRTTYELRRLSPGQMWSVGRTEAGSRTPGLLPGEVSRDHCAVGINEKGELVVENHNPGNETKLMRPELPTLPEGTPATPAAPESAVEYERFSEAQVTQLLSYSDVLRGDAQQSVIEYTRRSESAQKYKEALQGAVSEVGMERVLSLASDLRAKCLVDMQALGIDASVYARSISWAVWDLAKQRYYAEHPEETTDNYNSNRQYVKVGDPFAEDADARRKQNEIVDRHLGWELETALLEGRNTRQNMPWMTSPDIAQVLDRGERNSTSRLSSHELARLGRRLRRNLR